MNVIKLTEVPGYGWLPTLEVDGKEVYRGVFRDSATLAAAKADNALERIQAQPMEKAS
jgi:hypothetical protein